MCDCSRGSGFTDICHFPRFPKRISEMWCSLIDVQGLLGLGEVCDVLFKLANEFAVDDKPVWCSDSFGFWSKGAFSRPGQRQTTDTLNSSTKWAKLCVSCLFCVSPLYNRAVLPDQPGLKGLHHLFAHSCVTRNTSNSNYHVLKPSKSQWVASGRTPVLSFTVFCCGGTREKEEELSGAEESLESVSLTIAMNPKVTKANRGDMTWFSAPPECSCSLGTEAGERGARSL